MRFQHTWSYIPHDLEEALAQRRFQSFSGNICGIPAPPQHTLES